MTEPLLCPNCLSALQVAAGDKAVCPMDGGEFRVLFSRELNIVADIPAPNLAPDSPEPLPAQPAAAAGSAPLPERNCKRHPDAIARVSCANCGEWLCQACILESPPGKVLCFVCRRRKRKPALSEPCHFHSSAPALERCRRCGSALCGLCSFEFPGDYVMCADCAAAPEPNLSGERKQRVNWSYSLAAGSSLLLLSAFMRTDQDLANVSFWSITAGCALSIGAIERHLRNPLFIWVAALWNAGLLAFVMIYFIVLQRVIL